MEDEGELSEVMDESLGNVVSISVKSQKKGVLIPAFELIDFEQGNKVYSGIWFGVVDPKIRQEYLLLEKAMKADDSNDKGSFNRNVEGLRRFNPNKYSDCVRIDREFVIAEIRNLNDRLKSNEVSCAQVVRHDATGTKTSSIGETRGIIVNVPKFASDDALRIQMSKDLFVDVHFDNDGQCVGFAFLNHADKEKAIKFGDNYISDGVDKEAFSAILKGLEEEGFWINGNNMLENILASLDGRKMSRGEASHSETEDAGRGEHAEHTAKHLRATDIVSVDFAARG